MDLIPLYFEPEVYVNLPFAWGRGKLVRKVRFFIFFGDFIGLSAIKERRKREGPSIRQEIRILRAF